MSDISVKAQASSSGGSAKEITSSDKKEKHGRKQSVRATISNIIMCGPMTIWSVLFILIPVVMLVFMSFMTKGLFVLFDDTATPEIYTIPHTPSLRASPPTGPSKLS